MHDDGQQTDSKRLPIDPTLEHAIARLVPAATEWAPVGERAFLAMGTLGNVDIRVRRWPEGTSPERVRFVHRLQEVLSHTEPKLSGKAFAPRAGGESALAINGAQFDVQEWVAGKSVLSRQPSWQPDGHTLHAPHEIDLNLHSATTEAVAQLHERSVKLAADRTAPHAPLLHVLRAIGQSWGAARITLRPAAPTSPPIQRWLRLGEQVLPAAEDAVKALDAQPLPEVVAHLSLWPAHILVAPGDQVLLLDLGSAVATTPLLDIAQLVTRFTGWTGENAERVLGDYTDVRSLSPAERRALPAFAALDLVIEAARLLRMGYAGGLPPTSRAAVAARAGAQEMLNSLEAVMSAVIRAQTIVPLAKKRRLAKINRPAGAPGPRRPSNKPRKP